MKKTILVTIASFLVLCSCHVSNKTFNDGDKWIPKDFDAKHSVLLIEKFPLRKEKYNQAMVDFLVQKYPYKYEVVERAVIENKKGKYADTKLYQFGLLWTRIVRPGYGTSSSMQMVEDFEGNFYDRSTNTNYPKTTKTRSYGYWSYKPVINTIVAYAK